MKCVTVALLGGFLALVVTTAHAQTASTIDVVTEPAGASCTFLEGGALAGSIAVTPGQATVNASGGELLLVCGKDGHANATIRLVPQVLGAVYDNMDKQGGLPLLAAGDGQSGIYPDKVELALQPNSFEDTEARVAYLRRQRDLVETRVTALLQKFNAECALAAAKGQACPAFPDRLMAHRDLQLAALSGTSVQSLRVAPTPQPGRSTEAAAAAAASTAQTTEAETENDAPTAADKQAEKELDDAAARIFAKYGGGAKPGGGQPTCIEQARMLGREPHGHLCMKITSSVTLESLDACISPVYRVTSTLSFLSGQEFLIDEETFGVQWSDLTCFFATRGTWAFAAGESRRIVIIEAATRPSTRLCKIGVDCGG